MNSRHPEALVVAIDGPAASGKGTLAKRLAAHFGLRHLDTGLIYRAVGAALLKAGRAPSDEEAALDAARTLDPASFADPALRREEAGAAASMVATMPAVRAALLAFQQNFAHQPPGAVLDGRDIATVVCPNADVKLFITASAEKRAERRVKELRERGLSVIPEQILEDLRQRDAQDSARAAAPLIQSADAILIDSSELDADAVFALAADIVARRLKPSAS